MIKWHNYKKRLNILRKLSISALEKCISTEVCQAARTWDLNKKYHTLQTGLQECWTSKTKGLHMSRVYELIGITGDKQCCCLVMYWSAVCNAPHLWPLFELPLINFVISFWHLYFVKSMTSSLQSVHFSLRSRGCAEPGMLHLECTKRSWKLKVCFSGAEICLFAMPFWGIFHLIVELKTLLQTFLLKRSINLTNTVFNAS